jgi:tetratricopeptide (TPR) repeat protein
VAALAAVLYGRPFFLGGGSPEAKLARDLANARSILNKADGNVEFALKVAQRAAECAEANAPGRSGEAALLVGWAWQRLAEKAEASRAPEMWRQSRAALQQARQLGVAEEDKARLAFRLGKANLNGGALPQALDDLEAASKGCLEHRVEAYILLADGCLKAQPPQLQRALDANRELRELAHEITPDQANAAKLQGGSILLQLGKAKEARDSLEKIGDDAAPHILRQARLLRARSFQEEARWQEAAAVYAEALADARGPMPEAASALYALGECYHRLSQPNEAIKAWTECVRVAQGPEKLAAAVALAEEHLALPDLDKAAAALASAAALAPATARWDNPYLTAEVYGTVVTRILEAMYQAGRPELVLGLATAHARASAPRGALEMKARAAAARAAQLKEKLGPKPTPEALKEVSEAFARAGAAREEAASLPELTPQERGEEVFQAALHYLAAGDSHRGAGALFRLVKSEGAKKERLGEAWFRLGEHYRETGKKNEAADAYRKCMEFSTSFAYRAQFQLAMAALEEGDLDFAESALSQNVRSLRFEQDRELQAQSLFALGDLLYQRKDHRRVVRYLDDAIGQLKDLPAFKGSPELSRARFQLADSFRQIALQESQNIHLGGTASKEAREHFEKQHRIWLRRAADELLSLDQHLRSPAGKGHLTAEQRVQAPFIAARALFSLGDTAEALAVFERLIKEHGNTSEGLDALGGAVMCHYQMKKPALARQRMLQIELALPHVAPEIQERWKGWLKEALPVLPPLDPKDEPAPKSPVAPREGPAPAADGPVLGPAPKVITPRGEYPPREGPGRPGGSPGPG